MSEATLDSPMQSFRFHSTSNSHGISSGVLFAGPPFKSDFSYPIQTTTSTNGKNFPSSPFNAKLAPEKENIEETPTKKIRHFGNFLTNISSEHLRVEEENLENYRNIQSRKIAKYAGEYEEDILLGESEREGVVEQTHQIIFNNPIQLSTQVSGVFPLNPTAQTKYLESQIASLQVGHSIEIQKKNAEIEQLRLNIEQLRAQTSLEKETMLKEAKLLKKAVQLQDQKLKETSSQIAHLEEMLKRGASYTQQLENNNQDLVHQLSTALQIIQHFKGSNSSYDYSPSGFNLPPPPPDVY